jgi:ATP-dependent DNA helicase RecG
MQRSWEELAQHCNTHNNTIRRYLNQFIKENLLERQSKKLRDADAQYAFKTH